MPASGIAFLPLAIILNPPVYKEKAGLRPPHSLVIDDGLAVLSGYGSVGEQLLVNQIVPLLIVAVCIQRREGQSRSSCSAAARIQRRTSRYAHAIYMDVEISLDRGRSAVVAGAHDRIGDYQLAAGRAGRGQDVRYIGIGNAAAVQNLNLIAHSDVALVESDRAHLLSHGNRELALSGRSRISQSIDLGVGGVDLERQLDRQTGLNGKGAGLQDAVVLGLALRSGRHREDIAVELGVRKGELHAALAGDEADRGLAPAAVNGGIVVGRGEVAGRAGVRMEESSIAAQEVDLRRIGDEALVGLNLLGHCYTAVLQLDQIDRGTGGNRHRVDLELLVCDLAARSGSALGLNIGADVVHADAESSVLGGANALMIGNQIQPVGHGLLQLVDRKGDNLSDLIQIHGVGIGRQIMDDLVHVLADLTVQTLAACFGDLRLDQIHILLNLDIHCYLSSLLDYAFLATVPSAAGVT